MAIAKAQIKKAGLFYFVFLMFSYTTGGPFGMEEMVTTSGPGLALLYVLLIPLFWSVPVSLVTAELTTAIPVEGGFYRWVRASYGDSGASLRAGGIGARPGCWAEAMRCCSATI